MSEFFQSSLLKFKCKYLNNLSDNSLKEDFDVVDAEDDVKKRKKKCTKKRTHKSEKDLDLNFNIHVKKSLDRVLSSDEESKEETMDSSDRNVDVESENDEGSGFDLKSRISRAIDDMVGTAKQKTYENQKNENTDGKGKVLDTVQQYNQFK